MIFRLLFILLFGLQLGPLVAKENCQLQTYSQMLFFKKATKVKNIQSLVRRTDCSEETLWSFFKTVQKIEGRVSSAHLNRIASEEGLDVRVHVIPSEIQLFQLKSLVAAKVIRDNNLNIRSLKVISPIYAVGIRGLSDIALNCHNLRISWNKKILA